MRRFYCDLLLLLGCVGLLAAQERVDFLLTAKHVLTMDSQRRVIDDGAVAIRGERIVAVGTRVDLERRYRAAVRRAHPNGMLAPGFINTHTHAAMSLLRGIADDLRLQEWLEKFIFPAEARNVTPEFVRDGTRLACLEMALSGTTTFTDMYYFEEVVAEAAKEAGLRGVLGQTIIGFPVPDAKTPAEGIARTRRFIERFHNDSLIVPAIAPHALYTNSDETLQACRKVADEYGVPLVIHLSETKRENDETLAKRQRTPTQALEVLGVLTGRTVAAHAIWIDEADRTVLKRRNTGLAHCPSSNMKLASGVAPVLQYLANDMPVGLGTDGPAGSNNDFDMIEEMNLAANLQKVTSLDPQALNAQQAVEMATIRGARALGMEREIGSLEAGKRADLIVLTLQAPRAVPLYNVYSQLVYALKGSDVRDVVVNGKLIVRDGTMLTLNQAQVVAKAEQWRRKISNSLQAAPPTPAR